MSALRIILVTALCAAMPQLAHGMTVELVSTEDPSGFTLGVDDCRTASVVPASTIPLRNCRGLLTTDVDSPVPQTSTYVAFRITNDDGVARSDVWAVLEGFDDEDSPGLIRLTPGEADDPTAPRDSWTASYRLGDMAAGETRTAYFYVEVTDPARPLPTGPEARPDLHLFEGHPSDGTVLTANAATSACPDTGHMCALQTGGVEVPFIYVDTIKAVAIQVSSVTTSTPLYVGGQVTVQVTGNTGLLGAMADYDNDGDPDALVALAPAVVSDWPANYLELVGVDVTFGSEPADDLQVVIDDGVAYDYVASYVFGIRGLVPANVLTPQMYRSSGAQLKHADSDAIAACLDTSDILDPVETGCCTDPDIYCVDSATNVLVMSASASPLSLPDATTGHVSVATITVTNLAAEPVQLEELTVTLPTSPATPAYVVASTTLDGAGHSDPETVGNLLTYIGPFTVPASSAIDLSFELLYPGIDGLYDVMAAGCIGRTAAGCITLIDSTVTTDDDSPAYFSVTVTAGCGNGFIDDDPPGCTPGVDCNEDCDTSGMSAICDSDCTFAECGDGIHNTFAGEPCDDGNRASNDGCDDTGGTCVLEYCGDSIPQTGIGEECDDGNLVDDDDCSNGCTQNICGNFRTDPGEECDDNAVDRDGCTDCVSDYCGDGLVNDGGEECDDGGSSPNDGCDATCGVEYGFDCVNDIGGALPESVCATTCGDGFLAPDEACDDGNSEDGDGCSASCAVEYAYGCTEPSDYQTDGITPDSTCDATCGDGYLAPDEACDDRNTTDGDGCSAACLVEHGYTCSEPGDYATDDNIPDSTCDFTCGDGLVAAPEACDDGNADDTDGCTAQCDILPEWSCTGEPSVCQDDRTEPNDPGDPGDASGGCSCSSRRTTGDELGVLLLALLGLRRRRWRA